MLCRPVGIRASCLEELGGCLADRVRAIADDRQLRAEMTTPGEVVEARDEDVAWHCNCASMHASSAAAPIKLFAARIASGRGSLSRSERAAL